MTICSRLVDVVGRINVAYFEEDSVFPGVGHGCERKEEDEGRGLS